MTSAAMSTGLIQQVSPSALSGRLSFIPLQLVDTTAPFGTNPAAGRNYDGILIPGGACANASTCLAGQTLCAGTCVDLATDPSKCGTCGNVCAIGETCLGSACAAPFGNPCASDSQCGAGFYCDAGTCTFQLPAGSVCTSDNQCVSGLTCQGGFCAAVSCTSDSQCGTGLYCDTAMGSCVSQQAAGAVCASDDQCFSGTCAGSWQFAERFIGQPLSFNGDFDVLSGAPAGPLRLQVGTPDHNLDAISDIFGSVILAGVGPVGYSPALPLISPDYDGIGEGSVAALFASDYSGVAFDVFGVDGGGSMTVDFFRRNGSLIDSITIPTGPLLSGPISISVAFQRVSGSNDIAGFSISNTDLGGLGYANFRLGTSLNAPAPALSSGTLALLSAVLGLVGMVALWRGRLAGRYGTL